MKNRDKSDKTCRSDKLNINHSRKTLTLNSGWRVIYDRRRKMYRLITKRAAIDDYVFYSVLNTDVAMELDVATSLITRSVLGLYNKLREDMMKNPLLELWQKSGENIIVLRGYNHRHLRYLEEEARFVALGKHAVCHRSYGHGRVMLALSVFGRREELEDVFYGLSYLRH